MEKQRDKLIELIVNAKRADPETCSFTEFLADFMLGYGVFVPDDGYNLDRLRELVEADKEGRCVVLPCKPGDKVYQQNGVAVYELEIQKLIFDCGYIAFDESAIGKTVFLTEPAARAALKGGADQ